MPLENPPPSLGGEAARSALDLSVDRSGTKSGFGLLAGALLAGTLLASSPAGAQTEEQQRSEAEDPAGEEQQAESSETEGEPALPVLIETVIVTASRVESPLLTAPAAIGVRTEDELASEAARTFADLFEGVPGISIQGNARRITEAPSIRGFADQQVVVRQDGARQNFNGAHGGRFFTDPDLLQRVEVLRGANSAVFGSGALGGVVSLTTRSARDLLEPGEDFGGRYRVGYQSNGRDLSQSLAGFAANDALDALVNLTLGGTGQAIRDGNGHEIPNTEDEIRNGMVKLGWSPGAASRWEISWQGFQNEAAEPTNANSLTGTLVDRDTRWNGLRASFSTRSLDSEWLDLRFLGYRNTVGVEEQMQIRPRRDESAFETLGFEAHNTTRFAWGSDLRLSLSTGAEAYRDRQSGIRNGEARLQFPDADAFYAAAFGYAEAEIENRLHLAVGVRRDSFRLESDRFAERQEGQTSPRVTAGLRLGDTAFLWIGASRGFRVPSLTELYADGAHFEFPLGSGVSVLNLFRPDPSLGAERGVSREAGFRGGFGAFSLDTSCFDQTVADYVDQKVLLVDPAFPPEHDPRTEQTVLIGSTRNISLDARLRGCEGAALYERSRFRLQATGSVLDTEDAATGAPLSRAPANAMHLSASTRLPSIGLELGARASFAATRNLSAEDGENAPGYRVMDLFLRFTPDRGPLAGVDWTLALNNLTDEYYAVYPAVVPQPGRSLRISASYRFGFSR